MQDGSVLEVLIRERQLDSFGHVNHTEIFRMLEDARWERMTKRGFGLEHVVATGIGPVILETGVKFRRELRLRESVKIHTWTEPLRGKIFKIKQKILNEAGEECVTAEFTFVLFDTVHRKMVSLDDEWRRALGFDDNA